MIGWEWSRGLQVRDALLGDFDLATDEVGRRLDGHDLVSQEGLS